MKTKQFLLTAALSLAFYFFQAQEKYEFMTIEYVTTPIGKISTSIDGIQFLKEEVDYSKFDRTGYNSNPLLAKVKEYQDKDWELLNFQLLFQGDNHIEVYFASLRKKKADKK